MIRATYSSFVIILIAITFCSCKSDKGLSAFGKRKYTPGYFADKAGSKVDVTPNGTKVAVSPAPLPVLVKADNPVVAKLKLADSAKLVNIVVAPSAKASITESLHNIPKMFYEFGKKKDTAKVSFDVGQKYRPPVKYYIKEIAFLLISGASLVIAFVILNNLNSLLLYTLFVLIALVFSSLAAITNDNETHSTVMTILMILFLSAEGLALLILLLTGHQD